MSGVPDIEKITRATTTEMRKIGKQADNLPDNSNEYLDLKHKCLMAVNHAASEFFAIFNDEENRSMDEQLSVNRAYADGLKVLSELYEELFPS
jgi:hypothetical protein